MPKLIRAGSDVTHGLSSADEAHGAVVSCFASPLGLQSRSVLLLLLLVENLLFVYRACQAGSSGGPPCPIPRLPFMLPVCN